MTSRERIRRLLNFEEPDRVGLAESLFWASTIRSWHQQGLPRDCDIYTWFDLDLHRVRAELYFGLPVETVQQTDEFILTRSADGVLEKKFKVNSEEKGVQHLDYLIKTPDDWFAHKHLMVPEGRITDDYVKQWQANHGMGRFIFFYTRGPFWSACNKMEFTQFIYWMYDHPDVIHDMLEAETDLILGIWQQADSMGLRFDGAYVLDCLGMKENPYLSPDLYRTFVKPQHEKLCAFYRDKGYPVMLHSDGNIDALLPDMVDAGFTAFTPVECRSQMDIVTLKQTYGTRLAYMGGIDVDVLSTNDRDLVEQEVATKVAVAREHGGYIFHSDGSVPPTVTLDTYKFARKVALSHGTY